MDLTNTIAHLRALEKNATPRPWHLETIPSDGGGSYITGHITSVHHTYRGNDVSRSDSVTGPDTMTHADGELITEMRNALPELLEAAALLMVERKANQQLHDKINRLLADVEKQL
jgi:hypothetical protein